MERRLAEAGWAAVAQWQLVDASWWRLVDASWWRLVDASWRRLVGSGRRLLGMGRSAPRAR
jgi:hypothetical protein